MLSWDQRGKEVCTAKIGGKRQRRGNVLGRRTPRGVEDLRKQWRVNRDKTRGKKDWEMLQPHSCEWKVIREEKSSGCLASLG